MTVHDARRENALYYTRAPSPHIDTLSGSRASLLLFVDYVTVLDPEVRISHDMICTYHNDI